MSKVYVVEEYGCEDNYEGGGNYYSKIIGVCDNEEAAKLFINKMYEELLKEAADESMPEFDYVVPVRYKESDVFKGEYVDYNGYKYTEFELTSEIKKPE